MNDYKAKQEIIALGEEIRQHTKLENLATQLVNELIDKIVIYQLAGRGKNRQVTIELHYRFIGEL